MRVSESSEQFLLSEYEHMSKFFLENERLGERRMHLFIILSAAIITAIGSITALYFENNIVATSDEIIAFIPIFSIFAIPMIAFLFIIGISTFYRILRRDNTTDEIKKNISKIRNLKTIANNYKTIEVNNELINDYYYDTPNHVLDNKKCVLRIRHKNGKYYLTFKGLTKIENKSNNRAELEKEWSKKSLKKSLKK